MCLKSLKRLRHTTRFRLTIWYAGLYLLYTLVLGGLTSVLLESSLQQRDHQHIAMELHEMVELYARSGVAGVQHGVDSYGQHPYFFVRLTGADRATLVLALPAHWVPSALQALDPGRVPATVVWDDIA